MIDEASVVVQSTPTMTEKERASMLRFLASPALLGAATVLWLGAGAQAAPLDLSGIWAVRADGGRALCRSLDRKGSFRASFHLQLKQSGTMLEAYTDVGFAPARDAAPFPPFFFGCPAGGRLDASEGATSLGRALLQFPGAGGGATGGIFMGTLYVRRAETHPLDDAGHTGRLDGRYVAMAPIGIIECRLRLVRVSQSLEGRYPFDDGCIEP
jgi:hypothetical protein